MVNLMDKKEYALLVKKRSKETKILENACISFLVGGLLGSIYHLLTTWFIDLFRCDAFMASGYVCLLFIGTATILTALGVFDDLVSKYKFGLIIPITGFAASVASSLIDYKRDGLINGLGSNMFKLAGSVILYGVISGFICAILKVIIYG